MRVSQEIRNRYSEHGGMERDAEVGGNGKEINIEWKLKKKIQNSSEDQ